MHRIRPLALVALLVPAPGDTVPPAADADARLRATHRAVVVECVAGAPAAGARAWTLPLQPVIVVTTMTNRPRPGIAGADPGHARIHFTPESGHRYELEVRTAAAAHARRVYARGEWAPVVRDRTTDRIVSSPPVWTGGGCAAGASGQH